MRMLALRVVLPLLLVVLAKVIVSLKVPTAKALAFVVLMDAVTLVLAPGASVPLVADKFSHACVFDAVQFIEPVPVLLNAYTLLEGE